MNGNAPLQERQPLSPEHVRETDELRERFAQALRANKSPQIEDYLDPFSPAVRGVAFRESLEVELEWRHRAGASIDAEGFRRRIPAHRDIIDAIFTKIRDIRR